MAKTGKELGSPPPRGRDDEPTERLAKTELPRERQLELYHFMKLNRMVEEPPRQPLPPGQGGGRPLPQPRPGGDLVGSAYALAPQDVMGPLIRNLGAMLVRGVQPREVMMQYMAKSDSPTGGKDGNTHFGDLEARAGGADLHARRRDPGDGRRGARRQDAGQGPGGPDLHRRRRHLDGRLPRGAEPRRGAQRALRADRREQRLGLLDAHLAADADQEHRHPRRRPTASPARSWTATTCSPSTRRPAGGRAGARRRRARR